MVSTKKVKNTLQLQRKVMQVETAIKRWLPAANAYLFGTAFINVTSHPARMPNKISLTQICNLTYGVLAFPSHFQDVALKLNYVFFILGWKLPAKIPGANEGCEQESHSTHELLYPRATRLKLSRGTPASLASSLALSCTSSAFTGKNWPRHLQRNSALLF